MKKSYLFFAVPVIPEKRKRPRKINCLLTKNMKDNYEHWTGKMNEELAQKAAAEAAAEAAAQMSSSLKVRYVCVWCVCCVFVCLCVCCCFLPTISMIQSGYICVQIFLL
jgi:hypothetical protein